MPPTPANSLSRTRRLLQGVCGIFVLLAFMFSWLWAFTFINRITLLRHKDHYTPATFVVTGATYSKHDEGGDSWWLDGEVNGRKERLVPYLNKTPQNEASLLSDFPEGTHIEVIYDPDATETLVQGESLRVMQASSDFWERERKLRNRVAPVVLLPVPLTLALYITVRFLNRRGRTI